ncbi:transglycosylase SLT domain-containing protein [Pseudorhodoplanes sp.]|uniref:transglycosylase SLT domain-containing protein n=1 Tax=Pseudorhodoplanes sp. TaxID=1934341 RepID=UPI002CCE706E|nr:transglycosylase SLT domain-containing protein [Pseudorhodoplanes sp.]HWV54801.1 transglycosylase SLT domain-containing protein [Pseudorhodoplanes sp.]
MSGANANEAYSALVHSHAAAHGLPPSLVHRVIMRESRYNPRAVSKGNYGMMQIRLGTARAMGYTGSAAGLLDPNTNMTYAVKYLAGAYRAAGGNHDRAVALYARGYHDVARRQGSSAVALANGRRMAPAYATVQAPAIGAPLPEFSSEARRSRGQYVGSRRAPRVTTSRDQEIR